MNYYQILWLPNRTTSVFEITKAYQRVVSYWIPASHTTMGWVTEIQNATTAYYVLSNYKLKYEYDNSFILDPNLTWFELAEYFKKGYLDCLDCREYQDCYRLLNDKGVSVFKISKHDLNSINLKLFYNIKEHTNKLMYLKLLYFDYFTPFHCISFQESNNNCDRGPTPVIDARTTSPFSLLV